MCPVGSAPSTMGAGSRWSGEILTQDEEGRTQRLRKGAMPELRAQLRPWDSECSGHRSARPAHSASTNAGPASGRIEKHWYTSPGTVQTLGESADSMRGAA